MKTCSNCKKRSLIILPDFAWGSNVCHKCAQKKYNELWDRYQIKRSELNAQMNGELLLISNLRLVLNSLNHGDEILNHKAALVSWPLIYEMNKLCDNIEKQIMEKYNQ